MAKRSHEVTHFEKKEVGVYFRFGHRPRKRGVWSPLWLLGREKGGGWCLLPFWEGKVRHPRHGRRNVEGDLMSRYVEREGC